MFYCICLNVIHVFPAVSNRPTRMLQHQFKCRSEKLSEGECLNDVRWMPIYTYGNHLHLAIYGDKLIRRTAHTLWQPRQAAEMFHFFSDKTKPSRYHIDSHSLFAYMILRA